MASPTTRRAGRPPAVRPPAGPPDPVTFYARAVVAGELVTGRLVRLACERHLRDLDGAGARGLWFDVAAAVKAIRFFTLLRHSKGEWAGRPFELSGWQQFIVGSLFGWKQADGARRFRDAYTEVARKNGKSTLAAGVGLLLFCGDGEPGAEVYAAATKRDQAKIVWSEARRMVRATAGLKERISVLTSNLNIEATSSKFEPLGADEDSTDGLNIHGCIVDELHAHKNRKMWDVLDTARGARRQPLTFVITTAGSDRLSVCWEQHEYAVRVLQGVIEDDRLFAFIASIDSCEACHADGALQPRGGCPDCDDWRDPSVWVKANPNLGVSVHLDDLQSQCGRAQQMPAAQNAFLRLRLGVWTEQAVRWLSMAAWDAQPERRPEEELEGLACYGGLDLSSTTDLTALVLAFPSDEAEEDGWDDGAGSEDGDGDEDALGYEAAGDGAGDEDDDGEDGDGAALVRHGAYDLLAWFWLPEERIAEKEREDRAPYRLWVEQGWITATRGAVVDYAAVRALITGVLPNGRRRGGALVDRFDLRELAVDRWNSTQLQTQLDDDGVTVVPFGQGMASMSAPTKEWERLLLAGRLRHGGNPVLRWMASNVTVRRDAAGNLKPAKDASTGRIDGIVAGIMAVGRAMVHDDGGGSVYETQGVFL